MANSLDAAASIYYLFNQFISELANDPDLPDFEFASTTSFEATAAILNTDTDKIVVMQRLKDTKNKFIHIEYNLVPSFSSTKDINSILTLKVFEHFEVLHKKYSTVTVYEAAGLEASSTVLNDTGKKLVIQSLSQDALSAGQFKASFNSLKITFIGYLK